MVLAVMVNHSVMNKTATGMKNTANRRANGVGGAKSPKPAVVAVVMQLAIDAEELAKTREQNGARVKQRESLTSTMYLRNPSPTLEILARLKRRGCIQQEALECTRASSTISPPPLSMRR